MHAQSAQKRPIQHHFGVISIQSRPLHAIMLLALTFRVIEVITVHRLLAVRSERARQQSQSENRHENPHFRYFNLFSL